MQFYNFHLMPWPHLPADFATNKEKYPTSWVTFSNSHYDPVEGQNLYNRYLDELEYAEKLGFDGVCVNEHHQNAYGTMPSPNVMAAMLARRTSKVKIGVIGNGLPLRDHPLRVAEEIAMLDVVTGGRIISGFVRGIGCEYYSMGVNPTYSNERFREAHDLIIKSWTDPGPFRWEGKHYEVRYVNVWPRPLQKPHPPIWIPGFGSKETIEWCAHPDRKYTYLAVGNGSVADVAGVDLVDSYLNHLSAVWPGPSALNGITIAVDCANGATTAVAPELFKRLGLKTIVMANRPDGRNINLNCGSTHPDGSSRRSRRRRASRRRLRRRRRPRDLRRPSRQLVNGDAVLLMCGRQLQKEGRLRGNADRRDRDEQHRPRDCADANSASRWCVRRSATST